MSKCGLCDNPKPAGKGRRLCDACKEALGLDEHGDAKRGNCVRCGGPKPAGRGKRLCPDCVGLDRSDYAESRRGCCSACGGPKQPGRGLRYCDACAPPDRGKYSPDPKPCRGCGGEKEPGQGFAYCAECRASREPKGCKLCGGVKEPGHPFYCADCAETRKWRRERKKRAKEAKRRQPCGLCGGLKGPGRGEQFCQACKAALAAERPRCNTRGCRNPTDGPRKKLCAECRRASEERQRERYRAYRQRLRNDPERVRVEREKANERLRRRRDNPEWIAAHLEKRRMYSALRREQRGGELVPLRPPTSRSGHSGPTLYGPPLAAVIQRERERAIQNGESVEAFHERIGVAERRVRDWRDGVFRVNLGSADQVLLGLGLFWWEVWSPETVDDPEELAQVHRSFEGEEVAA